MLGRMVTVVRAHGVQMDLLLLQLMLLLGVDSLLLYCGVALMPSVSFRVM